MTDLANKNKNLMRENKLKMNFSMVRLKVALLKKKKAFLLVFIGVIILIILQLGGRAILTMTMSQTKEKLCVDSVNHSSYKSWVSKTKLI